MTVGNPTKRMLASAAGTACIVLIAACGSAGTAASGNPASGGGSSSSAQTVSVPRSFCSVLSAADISSVIGQSAATPTQQMNAAGETDCDSSVSGGINVDWSIFLGPWCTNGQPVSSTCLSDRSSTYTSNRQSAVQKDGTVSDVAGLGDHAYCAVDNIAGLKIAHVNLIRSWIVLSVSSDTCDHSATLAKELLTKL